MFPPVYVADIARHEGKEVTLHGWLHGRRSSGKLHFLQVRDGTGTIQCVVFKGNVSAEVFQEADHLPQETSLAVTGRVNGQVRQRSTTAQLIFPVHHLVWFVSRVMTLRPGDIISTGTPAGIGPLQPGDTVEVEVDGVGILRNPVV